MQITTYRSKNAKPELAWLAVLTNDGGMPVGIRFMGSSEAYVIAEARSWIKEQRPLKPFERDIPVAQYRTYKASKSSGIAPIKSESGPGRGQGFVGKVWMWHAGLDKRLRVPASEVDQLELDGWVRKGPRG